ncbi:7077_t:CDS:2, partial [Dentiscutata erythropus]
MQDEKIFKFICYNLQPSDLLAMVCVCKYFKNILDESINPLAEEIWRNSRIRFTVFQDKEPPSEMNQQTFARLLTFEKGCQFCKTKEKPLTIYWIPGVRSCQNCMLSRASEILKLKFKIDNEILGLIVPVTPSVDLPESRHKLTYYWIDYVKNVDAFYKSANDNMRRALREDVEKKYKEAQHYEKWMLNLRQSYLIKRYNSFLKLHAKINKETLSMMQKDHEYKRLKTEVQSNPFLALDLQQYKSRILQIAQKIGIIQKQTIIVKFLKKLTYGSERKSQRQVLNIRDTLYVYLPICPSFLNPPDLKEYSQEFFEKNFLPTLINEAGQLDAAGTAPPPSFLDIDGALHVGSLRNQPIFECRLCNAIKPSSIKIVKQHIKDIHELDDSINSIRFAAKVNCDA